MSIYTCAFDCVALQLASLSIFFWIFNLHIQLSPSQTVRNLQRLMDFYDQCLLEWSIFHIRQLEMKGKSIANEQTVHHEEYLHFCSTGCGVGICWRTLAPSESRRHSHGNNHTTVSKKTRLLFNFLQRSSYQHHQTKVCGYLFSLYLRLYLRVGACVCKCVGGSVREGERAGENGDGVTWVTCL